MEMETKKFSQPWSFTRLDWSLEFSHSCRQINLRPKTTLRHTDAERMLSYLLSTCVFADKHKEITVQLRSSNKDLQCPLLEPVGMGQT